MKLVPDTLAADEKVAAARYEENATESAARHDKMFAFLIVGQWAVAIVIAAVYFPRTWQGFGNSAHPHLLAAIFLGGMISIFPAAVGYFRSGRRSTRWIIACAQVLMSSLLIHVTGGRIETHFHVFGSLAVLAFYRDERILVLAAGIVVVDHVVRGLIWPESVFGAFESAPFLRALEHGGWVMFELLFLCISIRRSRSEVHDLCHHQVTLENAGKLMEIRIDERTEALATSEARSRSLFENAAIGLFRCNAEGQILAANPSMVHFLGYTSESDFISEVKCISALWADSEGRQDPDWLSQVLSAGEIHGCDRQWLRKDGEAIPVRLSAKAIRDSDSSEIYLESCVEDRSDQMEMERQYLQAQKVQALGQLSAGIAHDFNNILTTIIGYTDHILCDANADSDLRTQVVEIRKAAERAANLTTQVLAFSRKQTVRPTTFHLNDVLNDMNHMLLRIVGDDVATTINLDKGLHAVYADKGQIQQVILNLVVNARDAMPRGGRLTIETETFELDQDAGQAWGDAEPGHYAVVAVSDTGGGIPKNIIDRIFEPFFTTKAASGGTGLGLSTCYGIAEKSGGNISVYSEPDVGTTFKLYIPLAHQDCNPEAGETFQANEWHPRESTAAEVLILFAEDESAIRKLGVLSLGKLGYKVIAAENGADALEKFLEHRIGSIPIIMTDVMMPGMGGIELAARVREVAPDTAIVFSSGYTNDAITSSGLLEDGTFFVQKPYSVASLGQKIEEVLEGQTK